MGLDVRVSLTGGLALCSLLTSGCYFGTQEIGDSVATDGTSGEDGDGDGSESGTDEVPEEIAAGPTGLRVLTPVQYQLSVMDVLGIDAAPAVGQWRSSLAAAQAGISDMVVDDYEEATLARSAVVDAVLDDASDLRRRLGKNDRGRLDLHLQGLHDLQNRLTAIAMPGEACELPVDPGNPDSERERARVMAELVAMAFACDLTRVVSIEFSSPASHVDYPDIGITGAGLGSSFHEYEHQHGYNEQVLTGLRYFVEVYGDFVAALGALPEVGGSLLDRSCILGTSDVAGGWDHAMTDFPLLVAGGAGGGLVNPGVHVRLDGANASRVPFTCLRAVGVPIETWGSDQFLTNEPVAEILA